MRRPTRLRRKQAWPPAPLTFAAALVLLAVLAVATPSRDARALPPAGTDVLRAYGQVSVESRKGSETIALSGTATVQHGAPYLDGGVEVADTEILSMSLSGQSVVGAVSVAESATLSSTGQIRSLQPPPTQFPASSFFDVFVTVTAPGSPFGGVSLRNSQALHVTSVGNVMAWPPTQLKYQTAALKGVDNDGDGLIDEDSSDDDLDHFFDEDPIDGVNNDTDARIDEDPPLAQCTPALCDNDSDGSIDEDPSCYPLFPTLPAGVCIVSLSITVYADSDGDGCTDVHENGPDERYGGRRSYSNRWDFYDISGDQTVSLFGDIFPVAFAFNQGPGGPDYTTAKDRAPPPSPAEEPDPTKREPWDMGPPDGLITLFGDIFGAAAQFNHSCAGSP